MIKHDKGYYYEDGRGRFNWSLGKIILVYLAGVLVCYLLFGCASHKSVESVSIDSTKVHSIDTVKIESVKSVVETKYMDRWNDRFIKVNEFGDTVIDRQKEYIYISDNKSISDSISIFKSKIDSLTAIKQKTEKVYVEKSLSWWQKFRLDTYIYLMIAMLMAIAYIVIRVLYRRKIY